MTRAAFLATVMVFGAVCAAAAQSPHDDPRRMSPAQQPFEIAQRGALGPQPQAESTPGGGVAAESSDPKEGPSGGAIDALSIDSGARIDAQLNADAERIDQLMEAAMARSNARVLAVKPVTR
jgi:hypothetical protein